MVPAKRRALEGGRSQTACREAGEQPGRGPPEVIMSQVEQTTRDGPAIAVAYQKREFWAKGFGKLVLSNLHREPGYLGSVQKKEGSSWAQSIASSVFLTSLSSGS